MSLQEEEQQTVFEVCDFINWYCTIVRSTVFVWFLYEFNFNKSQSFSLFVISPELRLSVPPPSREASSSWRIIRSSSPTSSGTKPSTPQRKTADGCCATWSATSSPQTSWNSPAAWAKGSDRCTQGSRAWRDDHLTPSKSAASEVRATSFSLCLF